jgi:hypothetical protein
MKQKPLKMSVSGRQVGRMADWDTSIREYPFACPVLTAPQTQIQACDTPAFDFRVPRSPIDLTDLAKQRVRKRAYVCNHTLEVADGRATRAGGE